MIFAFSFLSAIVCCSLAFQNDSPKILYKAKVRELVAKVRKGGCYANVCFTFDSSGSVNSTDFKLQKDFVIDVAAIIGTDARSRFAAAKYGQRASTISFLTGDVESFNIAVDMAAYRHSRFTSMVSGIIWCDRQLRRHRRDANKLVIIGNGENDLGGDPVKYANTFRDKTNGLVSTVGIGFHDITTLTKIAGDDSRVFEIDDYVELSFVIEDLVYEICGFYLDI